MLGAPQKLVVLTSAWVLCAQAREVGAIDI